ncbi:MAG: hypothetical protein J6K05_03700 [Bacteroidaceae bacterium]|nr:hypothetical protein [Bacteroidaceae bacterium]
MDGTEAVSAARPPLCRGPACRYGMDGDRPCGTRGEGGFAPHSGGAGGRRARTGGGDHRGAGHRAPRTGGGARGRVARGALPGARTCALDVGRTRDASAYDVGGSRPSGAHDEPDGAGRAALR